MKYITVICDSCKDLIHDETEVSIGYNPHGMFSKPKQLDFHQECAKELEKTGYQDAKIESNGWIEIKPK